MADPTPEPDVWSANDELQKLPPGHVLEQIRNVFKKWGIYNQKLTIRHEGEEFAFSCRDDAFVVYRLMPGSGKHSGPPGWPVCLVTAEGVIDECSPPYHDEDFFASLLGLADWLTIIQQDYGDS